jgi:hypothetical protein
MGPHDVCRGRQVALGSCVALVSVAVHVTSPGPRATFILQDLYATHVKGRGRPDCLLMQLLLPQPRIPPLGPRHAVLSRSEPFSAVPPLARSQR